MQKLLFPLFLLLFGTVIFSCYSPGTKQNAVDSKARLEVIYFHGTIRCPACNAVENGAKSLLSESYKAQLDSGVIVFRELNFEDARNKVLADKFKISYSTLLIVKKGELKSDFTYTAFKYAPTEPKEYKLLLKAEIEKYLY
jgi:hypothetical protein